VWTPAVSAEDRRDLLACCCKLLKLLLLLGVGSALPSLLHCPRCDCVFSKWLMTELKLCTELPACVA
jgi:hypothetical protein